MGYSCIGPDVWAAHVNISRSQWTSMLAPDGLFTGYCRTFTGVTTILCALNLQKKFKYVASFASKIWPGPKIVEMGLK